MPAVWRREEAVHQSRSGVLNLLSPAAYLRKVVAGQLELRDNVRRFQPNRGLRDSQRHVAFGADRTVAARRESRQPRRRIIRGIRVQEPASSLESR